MYLKEVFSYNVFFGKSLDFNCRNLSTGNNRQICRYEKLNIIEGYQKWQTCMCVLTELYLYGMIAHCCASVLNITVNDNN